MKTRIFFVLLIFILGLYSCSSQKYLISNDGALLKDIYSYKNDSLGTFFYFGSHITQYGFIPLDKEAERILSYCEIEPKTDTILFAGTGFFCINRYSVPSYLEEKSSINREKNYQICSLLDMDDNGPFPYIGERGIHLKNAYIQKNYSEGKIEELKRLTFIRKTRVYSHKKMILIEDILPYNNHYISMIYIKRMWNKKYELHTWKSGNVFYNPTLPDNMMYRGPDWQYDFNLRLSRENFMRLILQPDWHVLNTLKTNYYKMK